MLYFNNQSPISVPVIMHHSLCYSANLIIIIVAVVIIITITITIIMSDAWSQKLLQIIHA